MQAIKKRPYRGDLHRLSLQSVNKIFRTDDVETTALSGISLNIAKGEFVSVR